MTAKKTTGLPPSGRRWRIGLLFDSLWDDFEAKVWQGVVDEARAQNVDLFCFAGGAIDSPYSTHANRVAIHDLISTTNVDGLLAISGCIGAFLELPALREYLKRFADIPLITLSTNFEDLPCALVDNRSGMYDLVSHFIEHHGRKRIAFVSGPKANFDSIERLAAYRQALADHAIEFDPQLLVIGDFAPESGTRAAVTLVKERNVAFDALVAANDNMALSAMRVFREFGINVPQDVLVGGFDDTTGGRNETPTLTTVRQPTYELGRKSVASMVNWLKTGTPTKTVVLPTRLIVRGSCGCMSTDASRSVEDHIDQELAAQTDSEKLVPLAADKLERRFIVVSDILEDPRWARRLIEGYVAEYKGEANAFRSALQSLMKECESKPIEPSTWGEVLHYMFSLLDNRLPAAGGARDAAFLLVNQYAEKRQAAMGLEYQRQAEMLQFLEQPLSTSFNVNHFGEIVRERLPLLNINALWLMLYEDSALNTKAPCYPMLQFERSTADADADALHTFKREDAPRCAAQELVPGGFASTDKPRLLNIFPIFFEQEQFGYAMFEIGNTIANLYEIVNSHLISVVKGVRLLEETRNYTEKLERDVAARTAELMSKNQEIAKLNEELLEKNKVDVLTDLYNRGALFEFLKMEMNRTRRNRMRDRGELGNTERRETGDHQTFSVMMCDIDHFKRINDTYGHLVGDKVLKAMGDLLKHHHILRQEDVPGRFGGEEFIIVLTNTDAEHALYPARRFVEKLRGTTFYGNNGQPFSVTISIGISQYHDEDAAEEAMIQRADHALYYAKNHGRDQIVVWENLSDEARQTS